MVRAVDTCSKWDLKKYNLKIHESLERHKMFLFF